MNAMVEMSKYRHEKVLFVNNEKAGLKAIIAVHNTNLGPAIGGCRLFPYASYDDALFDVLRLSRGMSHKNAVAGLPHGGGSAVIDPWGQHLARAGDGEEIITAEADLSQVGAIRSTIDVFRDRRPRLYRT